MTTTPARSTRLLPRPLKNSSDPAGASVARLGVLRRPTRLVVSFRGPVNPAHAANPANYALVGPGRDGRFGTRDDILVPVAAVAFDPAERSVTLAPARRINVHYPFVFSIRASVLNRPPGGDFVTILGGRDVLPHPEAASGASSAQRPGQTSAG